MRTRHYGLNIGDIVSFLDVDGEIVEFSPTDNNKAYIKTKTGEVLDAVCEWCKVIKKYEEI